MDTRKVAREYRLAQWSQMIQGRAQSGQSIKDYCAQAGVSRNTYFYWQRKLREEACAGLAGKGLEPEKGHVPSGWARLEAAEASPPEAVVAIEISGCLVSATAETDPELLARVCRVLKTL